MRRARIDSTHIEIRQALRRCGWLVHDVHTLKRFVDFVAYHPARGLLILVDAKSNKGKLTESQAKMVADGWPIKFFRSGEEAARF